MVQTSYSQNYFLYCVLTLKIKADNKRIHTESNLKKCQLKMTLEVIFAN